MPARAKKPSDVVPETCQAPGCKEPPVEGEPYCILHTFLVPLIKNGQKASKRGDFLTSALVGIGSTLLESGAQYVRGRLAAAAAEPRTAGPTGFRGAPPRPAGPDPFKILGLPRTATADQIREKQRKYALLYHADRLGDDADLAEIATTKLQEVNEAAAAALKILKTSPTSAA